MIAALLVFALGLAAAAAGSTVAVGAAAASRLELSRWVSERRRGAEIATALLSAPGPVIGTAAGLATVGTILAAAALPAMTGGLPDPLPALIAVLVGIPALVVCGFVVPRAAGRRWAERVVGAASPWLGRAARAVAPLVPAQPGQRADLGRVMQQADSEHVTPDELAVISGVLAFTERPVKDIVTPRTEIVAVEEGTPLAEVAVMFVESGYSRLPVYRETLDNIVGIVYAFDVLRAGPEEGLPLRPVPTVPGARRSADLLFEMQRELQQFAVVLDEFGGTAGIVTFEDLLEELVGEIFDEHDGAVIPPDPARPMAELPGTTPVEDVAARFGVDLPGRAETVGGLLAGIIGRIPRAGERIVTQGLEFDVLAASPTRVDRVLIRRTPVPTHAGRVAGR